MARPNVVLLVSHDTGKFLSNYGIDTVDTVNFERLAKHAVTFDHCFCMTPLCAPARAALLTGQPPHQNGMMGLPSDRLGGWDMLYGKHRHLANVFKRSGYRTVLCGFEHETTDFFSVGFDEGIHGTGNGNNGGMPLKGAGADIGAWLDAHNDGQPFYMQIGCGDTHRIWTRYSEPYREKGVWKAPYLIDAPDVDDDMAAMQGAANALDRGLGEILDALESRGLMANTLFIATTDHGIDFPRAKGTMFDPGIEVFLFMRWDGAPLRAGERCGTLISHEDVYATILELCGIELPENTDGISFASQLYQGQADRPVRDCVYVEKTYHDNYDPMRGLRTQRYKFVLNFDAQTLYDVRIATAPLYNWFRFPFKKEGRIELYDLQADPVESKNLADDPAYASLCAQFQIQLAQWMKRTDDPLLDGPIASPYHLRISAQMKALAEQNTKK